MKRRLMIVAAIVALIYLIPFEKSKDENRSVKLEDKTEGTQPSKKLKAISHPKKVQKSHLDHLMKVVLSENPYLRSPRPPHSLNEMRFIRESSIRLQALEAISIRIRQKDLPEDLLVQISIHAKDPIVRKVARRVLSHPRDRSYFDDLTLALSNMPVPYLQ